MHSGEGNSSWNGQKYVSGICNLQQLVLYEDVPPSLPTMKLIMNGIKAYLAKPSSKQLQ